MSGDSAGVTDKGELKQVRQHRFDFEMPSLGHDVSLPRSEDKVLFVIFVMWCFVKVCPFVEALRCALIAWMPTTR